MATTNPQKMFERDLVSLQAFYPEDKEIKTIVRICDLRSSGWRFWKSPFATTMKVGAKNLLVKYPSKMSLMDIVPSDVYHYASPISLVFRTKILAVVEGHLMMWGDDDKLRAFESYDRLPEGQMAQVPVPYDIYGWRRVCPLSVSLDSLRKLVRFERTGLTHDLNRTYASVVCTLPPTTESLQFLQQSNEELCQNRLRTLIEVF